MKGSAVDLRIEPGSRVHGETRVPGDKSIAHRLIIAASIARGKSELINLPPSLDVGSTARVMGAITPGARPFLDLWARKSWPGVEGAGSTWNATVASPCEAAIQVEGEGRSGLATPADRLDCGNSGTTMRLVAGVVAGSEVTATFTGDESLSARPMERVASPLRQMGATVTTTDGHAPLAVDGGQLHAIVFEPQRPSAQVKGAVLLAGLAAEGTTIITEDVPTRDHTERLLVALGAPLHRDGLTMSIQSFQHAGLRATVPGDVSSAAFLLVAAALSGGQVTITGVGVNPTRCHFLDVMARMGVATEVRIDDEVMGEPVGSIHVGPVTDLRGTSIVANEVPLVIDEVPALAALAVHARGETSFLDAGELRLKESDRLDRLAVGIRDLGGHATDEGDDLVIAGMGLDGGSVTSGGDHRIAMALMVAGLVSRGPVTMHGAEVADVSFPGFVGTMRALGARIEAS